MGLPRLWLAMTEIGFCNSLRKNLKEVDLVETILQAVANVGFPIAISAYLLIRIEGKLEVLADSIAGLTSVVAEMRRDVP